MRPGVLAFTGSVGATDWHTHHAVQIMIADARLTVVDGTGARHRGPTVIVPADASHRIERGSLTGMLVFLDPESGAGRAAHQRATQAGWGVGAVFGPVEPGRPLPEVVSELVERLVPAPTAVEVTSRHPAVLAALHLLPNLVVAGPVRGTEVAACAGVSASRLTHLFTEQVGIPLRRYVLWSRLQIAISRVKAGDDLTDAAHAAGFADSAHLTRTCRDMFGLPPSVLSRHVSWDIDSGC